MAVKVTITKWTVKLKKKSKKKREDKNFFLIKMDS